MSFGAYKKTSVLTASKEQILLMLYEGAIKSCKLAKIAMDKKNIPEKCKQIKKAHDIVLELMSSLDSQQSPQLAQQLEGLYSFCSTQLLKANLENDPQVLDSVIHILNTLYEGWVAAVEQLKKGEGSK